MTVHQVTQNDTEVTAAAGDEIVVRVPENSGTGYRWAVTSVGRGLEVLEEFFTPPAALPGGGAPRPGPPTGERAVRLRVLPDSRAPSELLLQYRRPWEASPARAFTLRVVPG
ncbi:protease inhibitor I42 family protein [Phaeacidiphilus oryzae]|uniref:protease inhibitor I42 family protein n=1 Tax=Phaeacidiphilus oryzae TaxID=348818 RepID=UPI0006913C5A|nr:protease inhibitor I42 family protein [Phaeacidiphilus oryzae]